MTGMKMKVFGGCRARRLVHGTEPLPFSMGRSPVCLSVRPLVCFRFCTRPLGCSPIFGLIGHWEIQGDGHGWRGAGDHKQSHEEVLGPLPHPFSVPWQQAGTAGDSFLPICCVVHGPLRLLSSRESGEKAGLWEGEEMPVSPRGHLCFPGRLAAETGAQRDVELRTEAVTNERGWTTVLARTSPSFSQQDRDGLGATGCGLRWVQDRARRTGDEGARLRPGHHSAVGRWHEVLE